MKKGRRNNVIVLNQMTQEYFLGNVVGYNLHKKNKPAVELEVEEEDSPKRKTLEELFEAIRVNEKFKESFKYFNKEKGFFIRIEKKKITRIWLKTLEEVC